MECIEYNPPLNSKFKSMMCMHDIHISQSEESAHSESFRGSRKSQFRMERNLNTQKKLVLRNSQNNSTKWFVRTSKVGLPRVCFFLFHRTEFRAFFSSAEWFGTEFRVFASIFVPLYRIPSIFLLQGMIRNGIPRVFCSAEQPEFRRNEPIVPSSTSSAE